MTTALGGDAMLHTRQAREQSSTKWFPQMALDQKPSGSVEELLPKHGDFVKWIMF